ncbi:MAG TPA: hypothetical protein VNR17_10135 [Luteimicrobium sp.]|nr:hypothetical protein [Luteimicrobium sp.]
MIAPQLVEVVRPTTGVDSYGDPFEDWTHPTRTRLPGATVQARDSVETAGDGRVRIVTTRVLYARGLVDLTAADRVDVDGVRFQVDGEPAAHRGASIAYTSAVLKRATG